MGGLQQLSSEKKNTSNGVKMYSAGFGPEGKGVKYTYFQINNENKLDIVKTDRHWEVKQNSVTEEISRHGLYYGAGSITSKGPLFESESGAGKGYYDFSYKPIDMGDALGRAHDVEEDNTSFKGWQHPQNIFADIRFVKRLNLFLENAKDENYIDPFTGRKPSEEGLAAAKNAVTLFTGEINRKKLQIDLEYQEGKMSAYLHILIEKQIKKVENETAVLPTPNQKDK